MARAMTGVVAALFVAAVIPAAAGAATVRVDQQTTTPQSATLVFEAAAGEANDVLVKLEAQQADGYNRYSIRDAGATVTPATGCSGGGAPGADTTCLVPRSVRPNCPSLCINPGLAVTLSFALGDGTNKLDTQSLPADDGGGGPFELETSSGAGADTFVTGPMPDTIDPGAGTDSVSAGGGNDDVNAGAAPDGGDTYDMAGGFDSLTYGARTTSVFVSLDDARNDGATGENDLLLDVEGVTGSAAADLLVGSDQKALGPQGVAEEFVGAGGGDTLVGNGGSDGLTASGPNPLGTPGDPSFDAGAVLRGGKGNDRVSGANGDDRASGGAGDDGMQMFAGSDRARGGPGRDSIDGGRDGDRLAGNRGRDRLDAGFGLTGDPGDGAVDRLNCGPSKRDHAFEVEPDDVARKCEQVSRQDVRPARTPPR